MKHLLCAAALLALITPQVASAQDQKDQRRTTQHVVRTQTQTTHQQRSSQGQNRQAVQKQQPAPSQFQQTSRQQRSVAVQNRQTQFQQRSSPSQYQRTTRQQRISPGRTDDAGRTYAAPTRQATQSSVSRQTFQNQTQRRAGYHPTNFQRVRATAYRYPRDYSYRRWSINTILPRLFLSSTYYYQDWYDLGFGPPPRGYAWVRYGPDLLLVNIYTGRIRDVVYGVFY